MPIDYRQYPADWQAIRARISQRAGHCCEGWGAANDAVGVQLAEGTFLATPHHAL